MEKKMSASELIRGIANFTLSVIFVLSMAAGDTSFMLASFLGLIMVNVSLLWGKYKL